MSMFMNAHQIHEKQFHSVCITFHNVSAQMLDQEQLTTANRYKRMLIDGKTIMDVYQQLRKKENAWGALA